MTLPGPERQHAVAAAAEFDRRKTRRGIDRARIENRAAAADKNARRRPRRR